MRESQGENPIGKVLVQRKQLFRLGHIALFPMLKNFIITYSTNGWSKRIGPLCP